MPIQLQSSQTNTRTHTNVGYSTKKVGTVMHASMCALPGDALKSKSLKWWFMFLFFSKKAG